LGPEEGEKESESEAGWEPGGLGIDAVEFAEGVLQDGPDGVDGGVFEEEDEDGGGNGKEGKAEEEEGEGEEEEEVFLFFSALFYLS
jgi:hypothetical protein